MPYPGIGSPLYRASKIPAEQKVVFEGSEEVGNISESFQGENLWEAASVGAWFLRVPFSGT